MFEIKAVKRITVTEQVMEQIAQLITTGAIQPGEKLPNERELAERFQVTRSRVREALRALSLLGLITIRAGEGSFVNNQEVPIPSEAITWMFHNEINNLEEIYAARKLIESEIMITAAEKSDREQISKLEQILQALQKGDIKSSPEKFLEWLDKFDLYMGEMSGNRIYDKLMQTIVYLRRETSFKLLHVPGSMDSSIESRSAVVKAMKTGQRDKVKKAVENFFKNSRKFYEQIGK